MFQFEHSQASFSERWQYVYHVGCEINCRNLVYVYQTVT